VFFVSTNPGNPRCHGPLNTSPHGEKLAASARHQERLGSALSEPLCKSRNLMQSGFCFHFKKIGFCEIVTCHPPAEHQPLPFSFFGTVRRDRMPGPPEHTQGPSPRPVPFPKNPHKKIPAVPERWYSGTRRLFRITHNPHAPQHAGPGARRMIPKKFVLRNGTRDHEFPSDEIVTLNRLLISPDILLVATFPTHEPNQPTQKFHQSFPEASRYKLDSRTPSLIPVIS